MLVKLKAEPVDIVVIQVYMPTTGHSDEEEEDIYEQMHELIDEEKGNDYLVVMGDWNAIVGETRDDKEVGEFGLGDHNGRGERLVEFCKRRQMMVTDTWFKQPKRRSYTWKMPGDRRRYQIDYILVKHRYRNSVKVACSYPGADADSDHNLVAMRISAKLKRIRRGKINRKWDLEKLKTNEEQYRNEIEEAIHKNKQKDRNETEETIHVNTQKDAGAVGDKWKDLKIIILKSASNNIGYIKGRRPKKQWITDGMIKKMDERRKWKNVKTQEGKKKYRELNNQLRRETDKAREDWWREQCQELEEMDKRGRSDLMYARVKEVTVNKRRNCKSNAIKDKDGTLLTEPEEIQRRWQEYMETLYDKPKLEDMEVEEENEVSLEAQGPSLLESEIRMAIKEMKNKKSAGIDNISAEMIKRLGEKNICTIKASGQMTLASRLLYRLKRKQILQNVETSEQ